MDGVCHLQPLVFKRFLFTPVASEIVVVVVQFCLKKGGLVPRFQMKASTLISPLETGKYPGFVSHLSLPFLPLDDNSEGEKLLRRGSCTAVL